MNVDFADPGDAEAGHAGGHGGQDGVVAPLPENPPANPVHGVLAVCGILTNTSRQVFIDVEGLRHTDCYRYSYFLSE